MKIKSSQEQLIVCIERPKNHYVFRIKMHISKYLSYEVHFLSNFV